MDHSVFELEKARAIKSSRVQLQSSVVSVHPLTNDGIFQAEKKPPRSQPWSSMLWTSKL